MESERVSDLDIFEGAVHQEKVKSLYDAMIFTFSAHIISASVLGLVQWNVIEHDVILGWWILLFAVNIWRYRVSMDFKHELLPVKNISKWERSFTAGVVLNGLIWGSASIFLFPQESFAHQIFLTFVLAGMAAGAITSLSAIWKNIVIFLVLLLVPLMINLFLNGTDISVAMAAMVLLFMVLLMGMSRNFNQNIAKTLKMRYMYKDAKEKLQISEERFATIFEEAPVGIFYYSPDMQIVACNDYFTEVVRSPKKRLIGMDMNALKDMSVIPAIRAVFNGNKGKYEGKYHTRSSDIDKWILMRTAPIFGKDRGVIGGVGIVEDITEQKNAQEQIEYQLYHDALTGLPNRSLLKERLSQALSRAKRHKSKGTVLFLDLDHFKIINDSLGHHIGDELLKEVARRLSRAVGREEDTVSRLGGDEFVILFPPYKENWEKVVLGAQVVAEKIQKDLSAPFMINGHRLYTSASIGIALFPGDGEDAGTILRHADAAMYQAKSKGRGTFCFYETSMEKKSKRRLMLETDLRHAIERGELDLHYQPQIEIQTGNVVSAEVLLRWNHPTCGFIDAEEFIPVAEETYLIVVIGEWVIKKACTQLNLWEKQGITLSRISVNISSNQIYQMDFVEKVKSIISDLKVNPGFIEFELTEKTIIRNFNIAIEQITKLRELGICFAMDDFGTGYSSLSYLKKLPLDTIKIDRSFIRDMLEDQNDAALVGTILSISSQFGLKTVAQGVENTEQVEFLKQLGCDICQGYHYSPPVDVEAFELFWKKTMQQL